MTEKEKWTRARMISEFYSKMRKENVPEDDPRRNLYLEVSYCDRNLWRDNDGNYWEEYVPTYDW